MTLKNKTVLIIEDAPDQSILAKKILETLGLKVGEASSVEEAFKLRPNESPHVVLLDLDMPGKSGFDFLDQRTFHSAFSVVPVLVVSARKDRDSVYRAIGLGASDYVVKPYTAAILIRKVRRLLKDSEFRSIRFPADKAPILKAGISGLMAQEGPTQVSLELPAKLTPRSHIELEGHSKIFVTDPLAPQLSSDGIYKTRLTIIDSKSQTGGSG